MEQAERVGEYDERRPDSNCPASSSGGIRERRRRESQGGGINGGGICTSRHFIYRVHNHVAVICPSRKGGSVTPGRKREARETNYAPMVTRWLFKEIAASKKEAFNH